ncbi:MAG: B12-binding domain-containing radical SAM protein [Desulfobacterales bacterium]|nr:B12-binding domain-containing radical SAM protein [Desulfobacteraceae bacterium]MBT7086872.1 B12-binding domain-containing radical SAM protein [Desulfobacterales bacterium]MBT7695781.1 B12-binding domain-containing radical SAM protein [Desulfobacterales bacterium]
MNRNAPEILMVNPWIHDFAAYDFWAKPLGFLTLAAILSQNGFSISYIDALDRFHPKAGKKDPYLRHGRGPYRKTIIPKPESLNDIPRTFSRYGIEPEWFREDLLSVPRPDLIFVTSMMTYWCSGVRETIKTIRDVFQEVPIVLGGIYATLCHDHAKSFSGADLVVTGEGEKKIIDIAEEYTGFSASINFDLDNFDPDNIDTYPYPAFDLQNRINYVPILTSRGCPFSCAYCASHILSPKRMQRNPGSVVEEIKYWNGKFGVKDFAFYDDALLMNPENHAVPMFEEIIRSGMKIRFHTPNALQIREITKDVAELLFKAGFETIRLGLETTVFDHRSELDRKVTEEEFGKAVLYLKDAGFNKKQIGAYLLAGLPEQSLQSVEDSIRTVKKSGITPVLAHYTPIPHTAMWEKAIESSRYDLNSNPLFTNNAIMPCSRENFSWKEIAYLKKMTLE